MKGEDPRLNALFQQIEARVSALPGVKAASFSSFTFHEGSWSENIIVPGVQRDEEVNVHQNVVGNGYFETMQIPLLAGRTFGPQDTATSKHVAVISERMAKNLFPPGNPIGRHFIVGENKPENDYEVIGVVRDVKFGNLEEKPRYINYLSYEQRPWGFGDFEVRYAGDFNSISTAVQQAIHSIDHTLADHARDHAGRTSCQHHDESAAGGAALRLLRSARGFPFVHRNLRVDVVRGEPENERDRHPHGAGSGPQQRALVGDARDRAAGFDRHRDWNSNDAAGHSPHPEHALRASRHGPAEPDCVSNIAARGGAVRRLLPCAKSFQGGSYGCTSIRVSRPERLAGLTMSENR